MKILPALFFLALTPASVFAQSQIEMNREAEASFVKADDQLNRVYEKVLATLDNEGRAKLRAAQRAWIVFRDAQADFEKDNEARGGSMAPMIYAGVRASLTKARTLQLKELFTEKR